MTHGRQMILLAVLPIAMAFAGCDDKNGRSGDKPDSSTPVSGNPNPDTAGAVTSNPDSAGATSPNLDSAGTTNPDSASATSPNLDSAGTTNPNPDSAGATNPDSAGTTNPNLDSAGATNPDSAGTTNPNPDSAVPLRAMDAGIFDGGKLSVDATLPSLIDAGESDAPIGKSRIAVTPLSVELGVIDVGTTSPPVTVTVTNTGSGTSGPLTLVVSGIGITVSGCNGMTLGPQANCTIRITARSAVAGVISGTVEVGDSFANTKRISISGVAIAPGASLSLTPSPLDLGAVLAGETATGTIVLTNTDAMGLAGITIVVSGTGFSPAPTGTCTDALAVGQTCHIDLSFSAGATSGFARGTVTVSQGGVTKTVAVTATVLAPAKLVMTPMSATFQTVVGTPSAPFTFYVANAGDVDSLIPTVAIMGVSKSDFSFNSSCATGLPAGGAGSCQIVVVYNPKTAPATNASATLRISAGTGTGDPAVSATLTGIAVTPGALTITGSAADLGTVVVGHSGPALAFTVRNTGGVESGAIKVSATPSQFVLVTNNCTGRDLAPEGTCGFSVQFTPTTGDMGVFLGQLIASGTNIANQAIFPVTAAAVP